MKVAGMFEVRTPWLSCSGFPVCLPLVLSNSFPHSVRQMGCPGVRQLFCQIDGMHAVSTRTRALLPPLLCLLLALAAQPTVGRTPPRPPQAGGFGECPSPSSPPLLAKVNFVHSFFGLNFQGTSCLLGEVWMFMATPTTREEQGAAHPPFVFYFCNFPKKIISQKGFADLHGRGGAAAANCGPAHK